MGVPETDPLSQLSLPPGFRFFPTDEELLVQYLCRKVAGHQFSLQIIAEIDLYKFDPWVLPSKAIFGEKEWYFFSPRDRKYPNGSRPNRVAGTGYWKATGTDKVITTEGRKVGIKKALVFYIGKAPKGTKTNWIMHEYRLFEPSRKTGSSKLDDWVLCRIYKKSSGSGQKPGLMMPMMSKEQYSNGSASSTSSSHGLEDVLDSLPVIDDGLFSLPRVNSLKAFNQDNGSNGNNGNCEDRLAGLLNLGSGSFDWAALAGLNSVPELVPNHLPQAQCSAGGGGFGTGGDVYVPSIPPLCHVDSPARRVGSNNFATAPGEEEVQSGLRTQHRVDHSGFYQQNSGGLTQGFSNNSLDPYGLRYPAHSVGFGFER